VDLVQNFTDFRLWKILLKESLVLKSKLKLGRFSSGTNILDSGNIYTTYNQQFHWDVLRRWWLNLSLSLSLFIPNFSVLPVSLCHCLYREKDVDGGLCDSHISHVVHPKTRFLRQSTTRKKRTEKSRKHFLRRDSDSEKKFAGSRRQIFVGNKSHLRWRFRLDKLVNLTSWLDKLTSVLPSYPSSNHLTSYNLSSWLVKSTCTILISCKCRTLRHLTNKKYDPSGSISQLA